MPYLKVDNAPGMTSESPSVTFSVKAQKTPPLITEKDVLLLRLYNRVFICHVNRTRMCLKFYRLFTDTVMLVRQYDLYYGVLYVNVVDNVILVHHTNASVVIVFDAASPTPQAIGSPLPISGIISILVFI